MGNDEMHIADALEQGIFDIQDGCAKTMSAPRSVLKQAAQLIRLREEQTKNLEAKNTQLLEALRVAREAITDAREFTATTLATVGDGHRISELVADWDYAIAAIDAALKETGGE